MTVCFRFIRVLLLLLSPLVCHAKPASFELSRHQIQTFRRDGVLVIRGLLKGPELEDAIQAAKTVTKSQSLLQRLFYRLFPAYRSLQFQTWRQHPAVEAIAFDSAASTICASLMGLDGNKQRQQQQRCIRLLKDAVLGFQKGDVGCGWHVDDKTFWPCEDQTIGERDAGINVWITLSEVSVERGGGLAVAPGTHKAKCTFAESARQAISERGQQTTCALQMLRPDCHDQMEQLKTTYNLQPGDAIFHDRYIFHRGDPFVEDVTTASTSTDNDEIKHRVSLRYVPEDATFYNDQEKERAVQIKGLMTGDPIRKGGEYYPQTWPDSLPEERSQKVLPEENTVTWSLLFKIMWNIYKNKRKERSS